MGIIRTLLMMAAIFHMPAAAFSADASQDKAVSDSFTLLFANDFHGAYRPLHVAPGNSTSQTGDKGRDYVEFERSGEVGGMAVMAGLINRIRQERGSDNVILVHSGDSFSDGLLMNLTEGEAMIRIMNAMGFQFMAFGNHDFDYGYERTRQLQQLASFPMRGANVLEKETGKPALGEPTLVVEAGGLRVGLLALGYHNTEQTGSKKNTENLVFTSGIDAARKYVPLLREQADVVVVVSHQGTKVDEMLADDVQGIDVIVGGHSHDMKNRPGRPLIVQALSDGAALGEVVVRVDQGQVAETVSRNHVLWNDEYRPDPAVNALVHQLRTPHVDRLDEEIAVARTRIGRQYKSESPFDRLVGNVFIAETGASIAMLPGVGYGVSLNAGPVTREDLYSLLPHPSRLATVELTGQQIVAILEQCATNLEPGNPMERVGGLIQTAGMKWKLDLNRPAGVRVSDVYVLADKGAPIGRNKVYKVATHSGMIEGIHRYRIFKDGANLREYDARAHDIVERKLQQMREIDMPEMGLVKMVKKK